MPTVVPAPRDPRSIVTPDAFEVSTALLGLPLASPGRRLGAILVDLAVIGVLTLVTKSFALLLGVVVAVLFVRQGFKRTTVPGSVFNRAMRLSVGCLGLVIGTVTAIVWAAVGIGGNLDVRPGDFDEARLQEALEEVLPSSAAPAGLGPDAAVADSAAEPGADAGADTLSAPVLDSLAADTVRALEERIAALASSLEESRDRADRLSGELRQERRRQEEGGWVFGVLRDFVDELGFGFGWASLYLTVMLSWWKGQTVGKRLMGIRVVRLDGEPITWWTAFERAGGYAAGFATGLLGFAQVYWDANRQAIHDRIVGTVVVVDGADPVIDWQKAL